jgi:hypothetical protein
MKMLQDNCVFISSPLDLNDSFEMRPKWTQELQDKRTEEMRAREKLMGGMTFHVLTDTGIQKNAGVFPHPTEESLDLFAPKMKVEDQYGIAEGYNYSVAEYIHDTYRVLSLVENVIDTTAKYQRSHWGDVLMWSHYGDMFQGAAVLLDPEHFPNGLENPNGGRGFPINYGVERVALPNWIYSYVAIKGSPPIPLPTEKIEELDSVIAKLLTTKSKMWKYERELRMLYPMDMVTTPDKFPEVEVPIKLDGVATPAFRDAVTIEQKAIVGVIFGPEVTSDSLAQIAPIFQEKRYEHLKLYRSSHNGQEYQMDYMENSFEDIETFTREHTENVGMIKNHVDYLPDNTKRMHPFGARKTVNFNRRRPYAE